MRKIILCFLLMCCIGLWANPAEQDSLKNDSARIDSVQTESVNKIDTAVYLTVNDMDAIADKVVEKMKQENKEKIAIITKKVAISTGEIIIGVLIFILGVIVGLLYDKLFKKLKEMERKQEDDSSRFSKLLKQIEGKVDKMAEKVERVKKEVPDDVKQAVKEVIVKEHSVAEDVNIEETHCETSNKNIIYAKPLRNGNLKATTDASEAIYVISVKKDDNTGKFSLYENEDQKKRAIKNKDDMLDLFCNAKGSSIGAKTIKNLNEGEVRLLENDIWEVTQKAEIGFIKE